MHTLDSLDRKILFELDCNSRQSFSELARKVHQGRDRVEYRVQKLIERQIIRKFFTSIDISRIGLTIYKTYIRLESNRPKVDEFFSYLQNHNRIYWLALCDGGWDLIFCILARSPREFYDVHSEILSKFNDVVLNFSAYTLVRYESFSRNYLTKAARLLKNSGGDAKNANVDRVDIKILRLLTQDARMSTTEIAQRIKSTAAIVQNRITKLEKFQVISGYEVDLNLSALGLQKFKLQLFIRDYNLDLRKQFIDYCFNHPNLVYYLEQIGDCNIELELEVTDFQEFARIVDEIRGKFSKLIRNFNTMFIRDALFWPMPQMVSSKILP